MSDSVLVVTGGFPVTSQTFILREVAAMKEHGIRVKVLAQYPGNDDDWRQARQFHITRDDVIFKNWRESPHGFLETDRRIWRSARFRAYGRSLGLRRVGFFKAMRAQREVRSAHLIHCHFVRWAYDVGLGLAEILDVPLTMTAHDGHLDSYNPSILSELQERCAAIACVSNSWCQLWHNKTHCADRLYYVPNGICFDEFGDNDRVVSRIPVVVAVGNCVRGKRFDDLIRAIASLHRSGIRCRCRIVGGGTQLDELRELRSELGLNELVDLVGPQSHRRVREELANADIFAHCSERESFGISTVEAMASGLPVVVSRNGGSDDTVAEGITGFKFDVGDVGTLKDHLSVLLSNRELREEMGKRGRERARELFSWNTHMSAMVSLWSKALGRQLDLPDRPSCVTTGSAV